MYDAPARTLALASISFDIGDMKKISSGFVVLALLAFVCLINFSATTVHAAEAPVLQWSGDMRYRFVNLREATDDPRLYQQLRARLGLKAEVQDDLTAILRLATATSAISNNQTLGDATAAGMPRRSFGLDLAYGEWRFADSAKLTMGRVANPFFAPARTQLVFDHDLNFEGASASFQPKWSDSSAFATLAAFIISENYTAPRDSVDTGLLALELGYSLKAAGTWTAHFARFQYTNVANQSMSRFESAAAVDKYSTPFPRYRGNTVYASGTTYNMAYDFAQTEAGIEWKMKDQALELTAYIDWIANELAGSLGGAYEGGFAVHYGRFQALVAYAEKKSDSVVAAFTDSDFSGGGTDNRGTKVSLSYQLSDRSNVVFTDYRATRGIDSVQRDFMAQQLDLSLNF